MNLRIFSALKYIVLLSIICSYVDALSYRYHIFLLLYYGIWMTVRCYYTVQLYNTLTYIIRHTLLLMLSCCQITLKIKKDSVRQNEKDDAGRESRNKNYQCSKKQI